MVDHLKSTDDIIHNYVNEDALLCFNNHSMNY